MQRILLMIDNNYSRVQELRSVLNQENIEVLHTLGADGGSRTPCRTLRPIQEIAC